MTVRDIQSHLHEMYGVDVSSGLISQVTDSVLEEVKLWQDRPLEALYPIVYLDAMVVKMRHEGKVENRAVYTAIGINVEGVKSVLGLWVSNAEGAKQWLAILTNLKNRGMKDAFIICTDGLKGFDHWRRRMVGLVQDKVNITAALLAKRLKRSSPARWYKPVSFT